MESNPEKPAQISVIIHTKNEESDIERCLKSVAWADEVVVMDMRSTDRTVEIARRYTANIHHCEDCGYADPARNLGLQKVTKDWVMVVDADEEIPEELARDIQKIIRSAEGYALVALPRRNYIGDHLIRDSGWGADYQPRLFRRGKVRWQAIVHSWPLVDGEIKYLDPAEGYYIKHYNYADLREFVERMNTYTAFEADKLLDAGAKFGWKDVVRASVEEFNKRYTPREDGMHSLLLAGCMAFYRFLSHGKALERLSKDKDFQFEVPDDISGTVLENAGESAGELKRRAEEIAEWARGLDRELADGKDRLYDLLTVKDSPQFRLGLAVGRIGSTMRRPFETVYRLFSKTHRLRITGGLGVAAGMSGASFLQGTYRTRRGEFMPRLVVRSGGNNWDCTVEAIPHPDPAALPNEYRFSCGFPAGGKPGILRLLQVRPHLRTKQVITSCILPGSSGWLTKLLNAKPAVEHRLVFPETSQPVVSIIVAARNDTGRTLRCLASLLAGTHGADYEVILCSAGQGNENMGAFAGIPGLKVVDVHGAGFAVNATHAAKVARGKYLLFLSSDAQVSQGWLGALLDFFKRTPSANTIVWKNMQPPSLPPRQERIDDTVMIDRLLFEQWGGFDQKFEPDNFEVTDFAFHALNNGGKIYFVRGKPDTWAPSAFQGQNAYRFAFRKPENPLVSIIIPVHNQIGYTLRCLASLQAHTAGAEYEVIIGDDASIDAFRGTLEEIPGLRVYRNQGSKGFVGNCNQAAAQARGKYLLFLNNDTEVRPRWLSALLDIFTAYPDAGAAGSKLIYPDGRLQEAGGIIWNDASGWNYGKNDAADKPEYNYVRETDYCSGASLIVERELFEKLGRFSSELEPAYYEDADLAFKMRAAGRKVYYQPKSVVVHHEGKSCGTDTGTGMKAAQLTNQARFKSKWAAELANHEPNAGDAFRARERSRGKKLAVFIDHYVPMIDRDAGSRSTFHYVKLFASLGMSVKFVGDNFCAHQPYTEMLGQMGVEVLYGDWYRAHIHDWLRAHADDIDVVFAIRSHVTSKYLKTFKELKRAKILYYGIDIASVRLRRQAELTGSREAAEEADVEEKLEMTIWQDVDAIYYPSTEEAIYVHDKLPHAVSRAIPLNICESFDEDYPGTLDKRRDLMFVGGFQHPPNGDGVLWFLDECWPLIQAGLPGCKFYIVGNNPPETIRRRASSDVIVTGWISDDDLAELYQRVRLIVAPLRYGGGVKGKVVESIRHHIPPVITPMAAEGLPGIESCTSIQEVDPQKLSKAVIALYNDESALRDLSRKCDEYIKQNFSVEVAVGIIANDLPWLKDNYPATRKLLK